MGHRFGLARVVLSSHRLVVLDEPTSHLDVDTADRVLRQLDRALGDERAAVLLANDTDRLDALALEAEHRLVAHRPPGGRLPSWT
ncbi:MAG: ABC transporter ATP-binding protein [Actinomycetota bacterium]